MIRSRSALADELVRSSDDEDRAFAAFLLGAEGEADEAKRALVGLLDDRSPEVVGYAAQSLAIRGDNSALPELIALLDRQSGHEVNPIPWAVATLAIRAEVGLQSKAREALERLRDRSTPEVTSQIELLTRPWR